LSRRARARAAERSVSLANATMTKLEVGVVAPGREGVGDSVQMGEEGAARMVDGVRAAIPQEPLDADPAGCKGVGIVH
jgi:hypothetical protein